MRNRSPVERHARSTTAHRGIRADRCATEHCPMGTLPFCKRRPHCPLPAPLCNRAASLRRSHEQPRPASRHPVKRSPSAALGRSARARGANCGTVGVRKRGRDEVTREVYPKRWVRVVQDYGATCAARPAGCGCGCCCCIVAAICMIEPSSCMIATCHARARHTRRNGRRETIGHGPRPAQASTSRHMARPF